MKLRDFKTILERHKNRVFDKLELEISEEDKDIVKAFALVTPMGDLPRIRHLVLSFSTELSIDTFFIHALKKEVFDCNFHLQSLEITHAFDENFLDVLLDSNSFKHVRVLSLVNEENTRYWETNFVDYLKKNPLLRLLNIKDENNKINGQNSVNLKRALIEHPQLISFTQRNSKTTFNTQLSNDGALKKALRYKQGDLRHDNAFFQVAFSNELINSKVKHALRALSAIPKSERPSNWNIMYDCVERVRVCPEDQDNYFNLVKFSRVAQGKPSKLWQNAGKAMMALAATPFIVACVLVLIPETTICGVVVGTLALATGVAGLGFFCNGLRRGASKAISELADDTQWYVSNHNGI